MRTSAARISSTKRNNKTELDRETGRERETGDRREGRGSLYNQLARKISAHACTGPPVPDGSSSASLSLCLSLSLFCLGAQDATRTHERGPAMNLL